VIKGVIAPLASSWGWIVAANVLLEVNQGLAWSIGHIMNIDLVGPRPRGLAVGLNEFAGYLAVGITAWATGYLASAYGCGPSPSTSGSDTSSWGFSRPYF
jgi:predicted MFS family arabinose efflux permease